MRRTELGTTDAHLIGLSNINVILGRNGSGKSKFLRRLVKMGSECLFPNDKAL